MAQCRCCCHDPYILTIIILRYDTTKLIWLDLVWFEFYYLHRYNLYCCCCCCCCCCYYYYHHNNGIVGVHLIRSYCILHHSILSYLISSYIFHVTSLCCILQLPTVSLWILFCWVWRLCCCCFCTCLY